VERIHRHDAGRSSCQHNRLDVGHAVKVVRSAVAVGQNAFVEDLEEEVQDFLVRFLEEASEEARLQWDPVFLLGASLLGASLILPLAVFLF